jgi:uncharacterized membrane protein YcaP (DUF421 family)
MTASPVQAHQTVSQFSLGADASVGGKVVITASDSIVKTLGAQRVIPQPESTIVTAGGMKYVFPAGDPPGEVDFELEPGTPGRLSVHAAGTGAPRGHAQGRGDALMSMVLHAVSGYIFLTLMVRVLTRRPGAQMTQLEFVFVFLMGGIIILSTVGKDHSVTNCTCAVLTVGCMHRITSSLKIRYPKFGLLVDGTPLVLVRKGKWQQNVMAGMRLAPEDVMATARTKGIRSFDEIEYAVLERNGGISIIKKGQQNDGDQR